MARLKHLAPGLTGAGPQDGPLAGLVQQEQAGVVEVEPRSDQFHRLGQQFVHIEDGAGGARDLGGGLELARAAFQVGQQSFVLGFGLLALGDVADRPGHADGISGFVPDCLSPGTEPTILPRFGESSFLHVVRRSILQVSV